MTFSFTSLLHDSGYGCYFHVPEPIGAELKEAFGGRRAICTLSTGFEFHCAVMPRKSGGHTITVGKKLRKRGALEAGEMYEIVLSRDESEYQMEMPEELKAVLETDPEAMTRFKALTPGKQRGIMHLVGEAKRVDTRINRALKVVENLKRGATNPRDYLK